MRYKCRIFQSNKQIDSQSGIKLKISEKSDAIYISNIYVSILLSKSAYI